MYSQVIEWGDDTLAANRRVRAQSERLRAKVVSHLVWKIESAVSGSGVPSLWKTYGAASDNEFIRSPERRGAAGTRAP